MKAYTQNHDGNGIPVIHSHVPFVYVNPRWEVLKVMRYPRVLYWVLLYSWNTLTFLQYVHSKITMTNNTVPYYIVTAPVSTQK